jgi:hypothetical protein
MGLNPKGKRNSMSKAKMSKNYINKETGRRYGLNKNGGFPQLVTVDDRLTERFPAEDFAEYPEEWIEIGKNDVIAEASPEELAVKDEEILNLKKKIEDLKGKLSEARAGVAPRGKYSSKKDRLVRFLRDDFSVLFDKDDNEVKEGDFVIINGKFRSEAVMKNEEFHLRSEKSGRLKPARSAQLSNMALERG